MKQPAEIVKELKTRDLYQTAKKIADAHYISVEEMWKRDRRTCLVRARNLFWGVLANRGHWSCSSIAELCGMDHATVRRALGRVKMAEVLAFEPRPELA